MYVNSLLLNCVISNANALLMDKVLKVEEKGEEEEEEKDEEEDEEDKLLKNIWEKKLW